MGGYRIPGTTRKTTSDGYDLISAASGMIVSVTNRPDQPKYLLAAPANPASDALTLSTDDWEELSRAYAESWITWVTTEIGMGFHPDTPSEEYSPPLPKDLAAEYDGMIGFSHDHLEDVYEVGMATMQRMGWHEGPIPESAAGQAFLRGNRPI